MNWLVGIFRILTSFFFVSLSVLTIKCSIVNLFIINQSSSTVLITYSRESEKPSRSKLLEAGEMINFGKVYEASVQSYSTLGNYIAPAPHVIFSNSSRLERISKSLTIVIHGVTGRSLINPFGQWDYEIISFKSLISHEFCIHTDQTNNIMDLFPTAKRNFMFTPRYILGLPHNATFDDAIEAANMLKSKWTPPQEESDSQKIADTITTIIEQSLEAFKTGNADNTLHIPLAFRFPLQHFENSKPQTDVSWS